MIKIKRNGNGYKLSMVTTISAPIDKVFDFFSRAENLQQITPPWLDFRFVTPPPSEITRGTKIKYALKLRRIPINWVTEISVWEPPFRFIDTQLSGPYRKWIHEHRFEMIEDSTRMTDTVEYELPFGPLGHLAHKIFVKSDLIKIFTYRHSQIKKLFGDSVKVESLD